MKKIISLISVFILIFSLFCVPSFAYSALPFVTRDDITTAGLLAGKYQNQNVYLGLTQNPYNVPYYLFYYQAGSNTNFVLCTKYTEAPDSSNLYQIEFAHQVGTGTFMTKLPNKTTALLGVTPPTGIYYTNWNTTANLSNFNSAIDTYTSLSDGFAAANSILTAVNPNNPPSEALGSVGQFHIPPGYACYMGTTGGYISLSFQYSGEHNYMYASDNFPMNIRLGSAASLPSSNLVLNQNYGQALTFTAVRPFNILGTSRNGYYRLADVSSFLNGNSYVVIYNPLYDNKGNPNPSLGVNSNETVTCFLYPLTSTGADSNQQGELSNTDFYMANNLGQSDTVNFDHYYVDETSGEVVSDSAITIPIGGNTTLDDPDTSLDSFMNRIISIFTAPINHIRNLFNSGSTFMAWLSNLFTWLPEPVQGVITSGLVVLIVVGVIKFLWK